MNTLQKDDRVIANDKAIPILIGQTGTVVDPDHLGYVIVDLDNEELKQQAFGCFLPEELEKLSVAERSHHS